MMDRTSTKVLANGAIRYGVYDEGGNFLRYEYIKPEDMPTQEGTPFCKETILKDSTAAALGLPPETAAPDDALKTVSLVPDNKALVIIEAVTTTGELAGGIKINGTFNVILNERGYYATYVDVPASISCTVTSGIGFTVLNNSFTLNVTEHKVYRQIIQCSKPASGETEISVSGTYTIAPDIKSIDICAIGGGGAGGVALYHRNYIYGGKISCGGGGGKLVNSFNIALNNVTEKKLIVAIGAGGESNSNGGTTTATIQNTTVSANGGNFGGSGGDYNSGVNGASGGCGSGAGWVDSAGNMTISASGSDGANGTGAYTYSGGAGQGTSTRKFGEASNTLYCGAGASVGAHQNLWFMNGTSGVGGGVAVSARDSKVTLTGNPAPLYGGGGGAGIAITDDGGHNIAYKGTGCQGAVFIRWRR